MFCSFGCGEDECGGHCIHGVGSRIWITRRFTGSCDCCLHGEYSVQLLGSRDIRELLLLLMDSNRFFPCDVIPN